MPPSRQILQTSFKQWTFKYSGLRARSDAPVGGAEWLVASSTQTSPMPCNPTPVTVGHVSYWGRRDSQDNVCTSPGNVGVHKCSAFNLAIQRGCLAISTVSAFGRFLRDFAQQLMSGRRLLFKVPLEHKRMALEIFDAASLLGHTPTLCAETPRLNLQGRREWLELSHKIGANITCRRYSCDPLKHLAIRALMESGSPKGEYYIGCCKLRASALSSLHITCLRPHLSTRR